MRTTIKITLITLVIGILTGCTKKDDYNDSIPQVTASTMSGTWNITKATTGITTTNADGTETTRTGDLLKEGDNVCEYNSPIVITETTFTIKTGGKTCTSDNKDIVYDWKENTTLPKPLSPKSKHIDLIQNGTVIKTLRGFNLSESGKKLEYQIEVKDKKYNINKPYYFTLTKM